MNADVAVSHTWRAVLHARDGAIWVATAGGGVNRIVGSTVTAFRAKDGLPSDETASLCRTVIIISCGTVGRREDLA